MDTYGPNEKPTHSSATLRVPEPIQRNELPRPGCDDSGTHRNGNRSRILLQALTPLPASISSAGSLGWSRYRFVA